MTRRHFFVAAGVLLPAPPGRAEAPTPEAMWRDVRASRVMFVGELLRDIQSLLKEGPAR
jgi:hypothetical protein